MPMFSPKKSSKPLRVATRGSELALSQANWVKDRLTALGHQVTLVTVETQGDREQHAFRLMQGQGFFTKAVQDTLLAGKAEIAVHSYKDLPSMPASGLEIAAVSARADPRDLLLVRPGAYAKGEHPLPLHPGVRVGTSAARRQAQLAQLRPDLSVQELRGNVPTRLAKLRSGDYDAVLIAAAGVARLQLDLDGLHHLRLEPTLVVPAPAQGVLALECRRDDHEVAALLSDLHDRDAYRCVAAERGLMAMLQGGCQLALGAHARLDQGELLLNAWYDGQHVSVRHATSEEAACLAFEALGRPSPQAGINP